MGKSLETNSTESCAEQRTDFNRSGILGTTKQMSQYYTQQVRRERGKPSTIVYIADSPIADSGYTTNSFATRRIVGKSILFTSTVNLSWMMFVIFLASRSYRDTVIAMLFGLFVLIALATIAIIFIK